MVKPTIGILGGSGPFARIAIQKIILNRCKYHIQAILDQDYFNIINYQYTQIQDRTDSYYTQDLSPREQYLKCINKLTLCGVDVIGIACNSAHAFFDELSKSTPIVIKSIIIETLKYVMLKKPNITKIGLLSTDATFYSKIYQNEFSKYNITILPTSQKIQESIMKAIYIVKAGYFKDNISCCNDIKYDEEKYKKLALHPYKKVLLEPLKFDSKAALSLAIEYFLEMDCQAIILGCTELPLLLSKLPSNLQKYIINPNYILAESLVLYAKSLIKK